MANTDLLYKIKQWDNRASQWLGKHFYIILFEIFLAIIFLFSFIYSLKIIYSRPEIHTTTDQLLMSIYINSTSIVMLLLLIALGMLNIINSNTRLRGILKNIEYSLNKRRPDSRGQDD